MANQFFSSWLLRNFLGVTPTVIREAFNLSDKPVDMLFVDNVFLETDIAQEKVFKAKWSGKITI